MKSESAERHFHERFSDNRWNKSGNRRHCLGMMSLREQRQRLDLLHAAATDTRHLISRSVTMVEDTERLLVEADRMDTALIDRPITFDSH